MMYKEDTWQSGRRTQVVPVLVITCTVIFLLQCIPGAGTTLVRRGAVHSARFFSDFCFWQAVTAIFLHGGVMHLVMNMISLFLFGGAVAREWGTRDFLLYFLFCGVAASIAFVCIDHLFYGGVNAGMGASGSIFGVMTAFGMLFGHRVMRLFALEFRVRTMVWIVIGIQVLFLISGEGGLSNIAHLGGAVGGWALLRVLWRRQRRGNFKTKRPEPVGGRIGALEVGEQDG